jgi:hypothetical protein
MVHDRTERLSFEDGGGAFHAAAPPSLPGHGQRSCFALKRGTLTTAACLLKRPAPPWRTGLRVARPGEEFVDCDHRGASDHGNRRHHENSFEHGSLLTHVDAKTPDESGSGKTRELRGRAISANGVCPARWRITLSLIRPTAPSYNIANALETIATGLLSVAERSVTRPKLMVRPRRTTRASASTSEAETARMKCVVWSTVVMAR